MSPFFEKRTSNFTLISFSNFSFPPHFHREMEIVYIESGEMSILIDSDRHVIREGEACVVLPERIHSYETEGGEENSGFIFIFKENLFFDWQSDIKDKTQKNPINNINTFHPDFKRALFFLRESENLNHHLQKAYTSLLLARCFENVEFIDADAKNTNILYNLIQYMEEHYTENISLENVASAIFTSRYRVSRIFSNVFNMHFNDYLNSLRINSAIKLMEEGKMNLSEIAYASGFENVRTFNRAFKKQYCMTPSEYKKYK